MRYMTYGTAPISHSLLNQLPILLYATSVALAVPIDFQVGNYLHKFFKTFLPNNTNYRRKPGDEEPYKKYYSRIMTTDPAATLPSIEGLKFKMADIQMPTLPMGNLTIGTYNPWTTTWGTTPSKEDLLKMGDVFRNVIMEKSGFIKNIAGAFKEVLKLSSTSNPEYVDVFENYDERLVKVMDKVKQKMAVKVEAHYNKTVTETTTAGGVFKSFLNEMKNAYHEQVKSLFSTTRVSAAPTTTVKEEVNVTSMLDVSKSQELKDEAGMKGLADIDEHFITRKDMDEQLAEIITPGPSEKWDM